MHFSPVLNEQSKVFDAAKSAVTSVDVQAFGYGKGTQQQHNLCKGCHARPMQARQRESAESCYHAPQACTFDCFFFFLLHELQHV
jgi:hypothetical protein